MPQQCGLVTIFFLELFHAFAVIRQIQEGDQFGVHPLDLNVKINAVTAIVDHDHLSRIVNQLRQFFNVRPFKIIPHFLAHDGFRRKKGVKHNCVCPGFN